MVHKLFVQMLKSLEEEIDSLYSLKEIYVIRALFEDAKKFKYSYFEVGVFKDRHRFRYKCGWAKTKKDKVEFKVFNSLEEIEYHLFNTGKHFV